MSYTDTLHAEIERLICAIERKGDVLEASFITHSICSQHQDAIMAGGHRDFWLFCGYETVRDHTRKYLARRFSETPESVSAKSKEPVLPGFERLQAYYPVSRDETDVFVSVFQLTHQERQQKIKQYELMGDGCYAHADELRRFGDARSENAA